MGETRQPLIVVSNTSPLTNLAAIGQFGLRQTVFGRLHICPAVTSELSYGGRAWPAGFYLSQPVFEHALALAGEQ